MMNENLVLNEIMLEQSRILRENAKILNNGKKRVYSHNCSYLMGLERAKNLIRGYALV